MAQTASKKWLGIRLSRCSRFLLLCSYGINIVKVAQMNL